MTVDHNRNVQAVAEIIEDDRCGSCVCTAVTAAHGAGFIQQKANGNTGNFVGKVVLIEYLAVIPAQSVGIQTPSHNKTRLFATTLLILQLLNEAPLELFGDCKERLADCVVLGFQVLVYFTDPVDMNGDTTMDISIRNALRCVVQLLDPLVLKLFVGCLLRHPFQHPVDVRSCLIVMVALVVGIILKFTANRFRNRLRLMKRNASAFLIGGLLLIAGRGILILIRFGFRIGLGRIRIFT